MNKYIESLKVVSSFRFDEEFDRAYNISADSYFKSPSYVVDSLDGDEHELIYAKGFAAGYKAAYERISKMLNENQIIEKDF